MTKILVIINVGDSYNYKIFFEDIGLNVKRVFVDILHGSNIDVLSLILLYNILPLQVVICTPV